MSSKFVELAFTAGVSEDTSYSSLKLTDSFKKNYLCSILDIALVVSPDPSLLRERIGRQEDQEKQMRWVRSLQIGREASNTYLFIRYSNPFSNQEPEAVYDIKVHETKKGIPVSEFQLLEGWALVPTVQDSQINSFKDLFG